MNGVIIQEMTLMVRTVVLFIGTAVFSEFVVWLCTLRGDYPDLKGADLNILTHHNEWIIMGYLI